MATRNFWVSTKADGVIHAQETGPKSGQGGFETIILLREHGTISEARIRIKGYALTSGGLRVEMAFEPSSAERVMLGTVITHRDEPGVTLIVKDAETAWRRILAAGGAPETDTQGVDVREVE